MTIILKTSKLLELTNIHDILVKSAITGLPDDPLQE